MKLILVFTVIATRLRNAQRSASRSRPATQPAPLACPPRRQGRSRHCPLQGVFRRQPTVPGRKSPKIFYRLRASGAGQKNYRPGQGTVIGPRSIDSIRFLKKFRFDSIRFTLVFDSIRSIRFRPDDRFFRFDSIFFSARK